MAPLPPMPTGPGRDYTGSDDFMALFDEGAAWTAAAARINVFKLYGEWVAYHATDAQLQAAVIGIRERKQVLAVEMGPLDPLADCGNGVESFAGLDEADLISGRIRAAGGTLQVIALDEPWFFAHVYDGPSACHRSVNQVAKAVARFTTAMRAQWPDVVVGDTEPTPDPVGAAGLAAWLGAYRHAAGEPFAFLHLDIDWARGAWPALAHAVAEAAAPLGVPIGVIYNGGAATSAAAWVATAGRRVLDYSSGAGGDPAHVVFQSWMDKPDRVLPETDPLTFTALVDRYFDDRASLGELIGGTQNLALDATATASSSMSGAGPGKAIDGIADTIWNAGGGPPAWLEIDLGSVIQVGEIRLLVAQSPPGETRHRVTCRSTKGGDAVLLGTLSGSTSDVDQLTLAVSPAQSCRIVRIETLGSPSWIAWREIEVYQAG